MTGAPASPWNAVHRRRSDARRGIASSPGNAASACSRRSLRWPRRALVVQAWRGGGIAPASLYVGQHVAIHLLLALVFGLTLLAGREPLVTALARRVHGSDDAGAWRLLAQGDGRLDRSTSSPWRRSRSLSIALAPFDVWATFANLVTPLAILLMFVGEYLLRYRLHPEFERATLAQAVARLCRPSGPHD